MQGLHGQLGNQTHATHSCSAMQPRLRVNDHSLLHYVLIRNNSYMTVVGSWCARGAASQPRAWVDADTQVSNNLVAGTHGVGKVGRRHCNCCGADGGRRRCNNYNRQH